MKEPFYKSVRFWTFVGSTVALLLTNMFDFPEEQAQNVSVGVVTLAGLFMGFRTFRNTPTK